MPESNERGYSRIKKATTLHRRSNITSPRPKICSPKIPKEVKKRLYRQLNRTTPYHATSSSEALREINNDRSMMGKNELIRSVRDKATDEDKDMYTFSRAKILGILELLLTKCDKYNGLVKHDKRVRYSNRFVKILSDIIKSQDMSLKDCLTCQHDRFDLAKYQSIRKDYIKKLLKLNYDELDYMIEMIKAEIFRPRTLLSEEKYAIARHIKEFREFYEDKKMDGLTVWNAHLYLDSTLVKELVRIRKNLWEKIKLRQRKKKLHDKHKKRYN